MAALIRSLRRFVRAQSGAEVVEFALTLPLMLLVVLGIVEFGFLFQQYEVVTNAAREGARVGVLPTYSATTAAAQANVTARVNQYLSAGGLDPSSSVTTICGGGGGDSWGCPGNWQSVTETLVAGPPALCDAVFPVTVKYQHPVPFIGGIITYFGGSFGTVTLKARARMRNEVPASGC
jgi:Flp pilus assembly protein TadG